MRLLPALLLELTFLSEVSPLTTTRLPSRKPATFLVRSSSYTLAPVALKLSNRDENDERRQDTKKSRRRRIEDLFRRKEKSEDSQEEEDSEDVINSDSNDESVKIKEETTKLESSPKDTDDETTPSENAEVLHAESTVEVGDTSLSTDDPHEDDDQQASLAESTYKDIDQRNKDAQRIPVDVESSQQNVTL